MSNLRGSRRAPTGPLWFTNGGNASIGNSIGRITTTGTITTYTDSDISISFPGGIAAGSDGALWFTNTNSIGRITTAISP